VSSGLRVIVTGLIGQYPLGGVTWDYLQYVLGLRDLGHDVYYLEDTGQWPYTPDTDGVGDNCDYTVRYLGDLFARFGLEDRWAYRFPWQSQWFGLGEAKRREVIESADLLINVSGTLERPAEYRAARRMAYIDSDPTFTQVKLVRGQQYLRDILEQHDVLFSFGELLAEGRSSTPSTGDRWIPTRQPIVLSEWTPGSEHRGVFTTVMNWSSYNPVEFEGRNYGQKDVEFRRFFDLPGRVAPIGLELAAKSGRKTKLPRELLAHRGWSLVDPDDVCPDLDSYRSYIQSSKAEWSVAKGGYVEGRSGWFSCRSACYLAAGRPVVVQDTGFTDVFPCGDGVIGFRSLDEAVAGIRDVEARYEHHARAARQIAEDWFDADKVLTDFVERAMESPA
jgi:hypothetical protein